MRESIFTSAIRSFFIAFFAIIGICLGFIPVAVILGAFSGSTTAETETVYTPEILPNANNVRKTLGHDAPVILQINVDGLIGLNQLDTDSIRTQLLESRENELQNRVKGILLHINTPGGTVVDSDGIYRALKAYKETYKTPIYAYVDGMCASGGMYVAAAADKVYASEVSLVGSVGVVSPSFFNVANVMDRIGVSALTLTAGKGKDSLNPFRPWKPDEQNMYQDIINYYYEQFLGIVTANRPQLNKEKLVQDYGAHVFPASQAKEFGYIDGSSVSYNQTLQELVNALGIKDDSYQVIQLAKKTWFTELFGNRSSALFTGQVTHKIELCPELDPKLTNQFLYLYHPGY